MEDWNMAGRHLPAAVMVDRRRLIDALDTLADVAAAIEQNTDQHVPLDHDQLISTVRGLIYDLTMEIEASDLLS